MTATDFRALFDQHLPFVWRVLRRSGVPERDLEDASQEVFLVLYRRSAEFEQRSNVRTWLYGIAVRVALAVRRRAYFRRERLSAQVPEQGCAEDAFQSSLQSQAQQLLAAALASMPRARREVFVLYELEALTLAEIAAAMEIPEGTVVSRLYRAREEILQFVHKREASEHGSRRGARSTMTTRAGRSRKINVS